MNILSGKYFLFITSLICTLIPVSSKEIIPDSTFRLIFELSGGYSAALDSNYTDGGITPCIRLMWEPNRKLNIGLETGYLLIEKHSVDEKKYETGKTEMEVSLRAIPLLVVFNMEIWKTDFFAAMGASYVWTELDAFNQKVYSPVWNYSLMFGWGYTYNLTDNFGFGIEAKSYIFTRLNKSVGSMQFKLKYCVVDW